MTVMLFSQNKNLRRFTQKSSFAFCSISMPSRGSSWKAKNPFGIFFPVGC